MLRINNKLEIFKNDMPQFEQVAIVKFLVKEKTPDYEIYCRLKKVYKRRVLSQAKVYAMANRFAKKDIPIDTSILEGCKDMVKLTVDENGDVFNVDAGTKFDTFEDSYIALPERLKTMSGDVRSLHAGTIKRKLKSQKAYLQTEFKQEAPDIELEYILDTDEIKVEENIFLDEADGKSLFVDEALSKPSFLDEAEVSFLDEAVFEKGIFDDNKINGINLDSIKLPFLPKMTVEMATDVLMKLHKTYSCLLCNHKDLKYRSSLRRHVIQAHTQRTVTLDQQLSVRCRRSCVKGSKGHFHCSKCVMAFQTHRRLFVHFQRHFFKGGKQPAALLETNVIHTRCLCVDRQLGVFLVQRSDFGPMAPIHVQQTAGVSRCSDLLCQKAMSIAAEQQNNVGFRCKHLQRVSLNVCNKMELYGLDEELLAPFNPASRRECLDLLVFAREKKVSPVVEWPASDDVTYYSVVSKSTSAWCSRSMVRYFSSKGVYNCSSCSVMPCSHCHLVALYSNYK